MKSNEKIEVSVCILTYNQENYIAQCLDSVINQKTDFRFEIVIGEDCSTDGTRSIIKEYIKLYPNLINAKFHENNVGASNNTLDTYSRAKGKYIAHLDGDDYFLPNKLQLQRNFMEENPDVAISFHRTKVLFPNGNIIDDNYDISRNPKLYSKEELILLGAIGTNSSKMFIAKNHDIFMEIYERIKFPVLDYLYNAIILSNSKVGYLSCNPLSAYRRDIGISSNNTEMSTYRLKSYDFIAEYFENVYDDHLGTRILLQFLSDLKNQRNYKSSLKYVKKYTTLKSIILLKKYLPLMRTLNWPKQ